MTDPDTTEPLINANPALISYYGSLESRIGYRLLLGDTRHLGYYKPGTWSPFPIGRSLRAMEQKLFEALDLPRGALVLDAGCGAGLVAAYMARQGLKITAIDYLPRHVEKARRRVQKQDLQEQITVQRMDYHHLETIPDESHEGVYTMETFVHATDPEAVLAGFYRILKPGGRVVLHEYDNTLGRPETSGQFKTEREVLSAINKHGAMPTCERAGPGFYQEILEGAGFVDVEIRDYSENIRPMLLLFSVLAVVPFFIIRLFRAEKYFINTVGGATAYWGQKHWRYVVLSARKPGGPLEAGQTE
ncbi:S-adenosyl-L-methionine-dependent methyltransferase [Coniochaeta sp. PMI_546]|nr:S-adenosyl-L-methionine-dependent methyltransferase [Coniochaeta sp. PMI_546]